MVRKKHSPTGSNYSAEIGLGTQSPTYLDILSQIQQENAVIMLLYMLSKASP